MRSCVQTCVQEAAWRYRTLLRTHRFFTDVEFVWLFESHVLSFVEYRTPAVYHAAATTLSPFINALFSFLKKVGISEMDALVFFRLAPLSSRRDIVMLGVIRWAVLGEGPPQPRILLRTRQFGLAAQSAI